MYIALAPFRRKLAGRELPIIEAGTDRILDNRVGLRPIWIKVVPRGNEETADAKR